MIDWDCLSKNYYNSINIFVSVHAYAIKLGSYILLRNKYKSLAGTTTMNTNPLFWRCLGLSLRL